MFSKKQSRRAFLEKLGVGCAHVGATTLLSGIANMGLLNASAAANKSWVNPANNSYKALVCILLSGGNDSFNMLVPRSQDAYNDYATARTNIALPKESLLPINPLNPDGKQYGLHPNLTNVQQLFESEKLAFVANCGVLVQPTSMNDYNSALKLPFGLFSHSDQARHWQTSVPQDRNSVGWGGRLADILHTNNSNQNVSMSVSLSGTNLYQRGNTIQPFSAGYNNNGSTLINGSSSTSFYNTLKRQTLDDILEQNYQNTLEKAYANTIVGSKNSSLEFDAAVANGTPITTAFETDEFSKRMKMTARIIAAQSNLNVTNQTFFIQMSGYDNHDSNLADHANLMTRLDAALSSFNQAMEELGMEDNVTTFTISDFGRKLVSNGDGTDHAWGGHVMVMGGAVQGKKIYGEYPDLYLGSPLDTGGGRFIPTTSTDEYFAELATWFGASPSDLSYIFPNLPNFWSPDQGTSPLGFFN